MRIPGKTVLLLTFGLLILISGFICNRYFLLPDFTDGLMKGSAIGLLFLSLISRQQKNRLHKTK